MSLRVTMLGSGTSTGVPVIGCDCKVCTSPDPRNRRTRPGLKLEWDGHTVLVDTPVDFRDQALRHDVRRVDGVLFTHSHADHIFGLDDLRIFNFRQKQAIPCFGSAATMADLRRVFAYAFEAGQEGGGKPRLDLVEVRDPFVLHQRRIEPVPVFHGRLEVFGYRIGAFAYVTDVSAIPDHAYLQLADVDTLILGALRYRSHPTHFTIAEATEAAHRIGARRTIFTHLAHDVDHTSPAAPLAPGTELGYDGLVFDVA